MTAKSATSGKATRRRSTATSSRRRSSPSSTKPRNARSPSKKKTARKTAKGAKDAKSAKKIATKPKAAKTRAPRKTPPKERRRKPHEAPVSKRQRYNSLGQHEVCYQAWLAEGTFAGAVRRLHTIEGFESIDERTLQSIYAEKKGSDGDWDERAKTFYRELAHRLDSDAAEEVASMTAALRRKALKGLLKLADVAMDGVPKAAKKVLKDVANGDASTQERLYGFPKLLTALVTALRPPAPARGGDVTVPVDARRLVFNLGDPVSPHRAAKTLTQQEIDSQLKRKELACDRQEV